MRCPAEGSLTMRKTLARYLNGTPDAFVWMPMPKLDGRLELIGYSDSDVAGFVGSPKSQSSEIR